MLVLFWVPWECNGHCNEILHLTQDVTIVKVLAHVYGDSKVCKFYPV
jgi:hypothetical protein